VLLIPNHFGPLFNYLCKNDKNFSFHLFIICNNFYQLNRETFYMYVYVLCKWCWSTIYLFLLDLIFAMATEASDQIVALSTLQLRNQSKWCYFSFELLVHSVQNKKKYLGNDFIVQDKKEKRYLRKLIFYCTPHFSCCKGIMGNSW
jgi:hypothetical protein